MSKKILCVDDDLNVLSAFQRQMRGRFEIVGALGGEKGLRALAEQGPFAVVVSDLQMPGMGGLDFLSQVRTLAPESVRVILSGRADLETAIAAVNEGNIFRFLTKPCAPELLSRTFSQAIEQHLLIVAEKELLEKTLHGSVRMLIDLLALQRPSLFSRSARIQKYTLHIASALNALEWKWQFEMAAMLSQIGCITLSENVIAKSLEHVQLNPAELSEYASHPATGAKLIANIPRLEPVAEIISLQQQAFHLFGKTAPDREMVDFGAQALRAAIDFDKLRSGTIGCNNPIELLKVREGEYNPRMLAALSSFESTTEPMRRTRVCVNELKPKMITLGNVYASDGKLLLAQDLEISETIIAVLIRLTQTRGVREPIDVLAPLNALPKDEL